MNLIRKFLRPLALIVSVLMIGVFAPTAQATHDRAHQRPRSGVSTWVPRTLTFNSGYNATTDSTYFEFGFQWYQNEHTKDLEGPAQVLELNAEIPCINASDNQWADEDWGNQGYKQDVWSTNIPNAALPYEDTLFDDGCADGRVSVGFGILNAAALVPNTWYYATVGSYGTYPSDTPADQYVTLKAQTGTTYDNDNPLLGYDNRDCSWSSGEIAAWNSNSDTSAWADRLDASWCAWPDFAHTITKDDSQVLRTRQYKQLTTDHLANQGLEDTTCSGFNCYHTDIGNSATRYCNDVMPAFDGACFVTFNKGSISTSSIYQDRPNPYGGQWPAGGYTAEAAVRCRTGMGVSSCPITMAVHGIWNSVESQSAYFEVPANNQWYVCRTNFDQNDGIDQFGSAHDYLRWQLVNHSGLNLDFDYTFLGGKTKIHPVGAGGSLSTAQPVCTAQ